MKKICLFLILIFCFLLIGIKNSFAEYSVGTFPTPLISGTLITETRNGGNVYSPSVLYENGKYKMWYGAQGQDGHDRIHYAESTDGFNWIKYGVAINVDPGVDHVNDPEVIKVDSTYYMYYTYELPVLDSIIYLATSSDGLSWTVIGKVLDQGTGDDWDSCYIYSPTVQYLNNQFVMWYSGRRTITPQIAERGEMDCPIEDISMQPLGYATSVDGIHWTKNPNPVILQDIGGIDLEVLDGFYYLFASESSAGMIGFTSSDGILWKKVRPFPIIPNTNQYFDMYGTFSPSILKMSDDTIFLFAGAASDPGLGKNSIIGGQMTIQEFKDVFIPRCTIQGLVYTNTGQQCFNSDILICGTEFQIIRNVIDVKNTNPYFFKNVFATSPQSVSLTLSSTGYNIFHSLCLDCINHPPESFILGNSISITCNNAIYADLHWKIEKIGDINLDEKVDTSDLLILITDFGKTNGFNPNADLNKDNKVDLKDLVILAKEIGR